MPRSMPRSTPRSTLGRSQEQQDGKRYAHQKGEDPFRSHPGLRVRSGTRLLEVDKRRMQNALIITQA